MCRNAQKKIRNPGVIGFFLVSKLVVHFDVIAARLGRIVVFDQKIGASGLQF